MKLIALGDHVIILPDPKNNKTSSGLMLPENEVKMPNKGTVCNVGPECKGSLKPNDTVIYSKYVGVEVEVEGVVYRMAREKELFAKIEA